MAKYAFYCENYSELCNLLQLFYEDLNSIYRTKGISVLVDLKGKKPQMQMMIAQSYALYTALDDTVTMDENWTLESLYLNEILYEAHRLTDTNDVSPEAISFPYEGELPPAQNGQNSDDSLNQNGTGENFAEQNGNASQNALKQEMVVCFPYDLVGCSASVAFGRSVMLFLVLCASRGLIKKKKR